MKILFGSLLIVLVVVINSIDPKALRRGGPRLGKNSAGPSTQTDNMRNHWVPSSPEKTDVLTKRELESLKWHLNAADDMKAENSDTHMSAHSTTADEIYQSHEHAHRTGESNAPQNGGSNAQPMVIHELSRGGSEYKRFGEFRKGDSERREVHVTGYPDKTIGFMKHVVYLWLAEDKQTVRRAHFVGSALPESWRDYKKNNFVCRPAQIGGFRIVAYVFQNETLMGVRAPFPTNQNIMEPASDLWFINFANTVFKVVVHPQSGKPLDIFLAVGNRNRQELGDSCQSVVFPWGKIYKQLIFLMYTDKHDEEKITGAFLVPPQDPSAAVHPVKELHNLLNNQLKIQ